MGFEREQVNVYVQMVNASMKGILYLPKGGRLTDFINNASKGFIPLTEATVQMGEKTTKTKLIQLNKDYIVYIIPEESITEQ